MVQYLLEIGMEEIPARFLLSLRNQLQEKVENYLKDERITYGRVESFATPRRLAVRVSDLAEKQTSKEEEVRGPSLKVARDEEGKLTKAALGFLRGQGAKEEDIFVKTVKNTDYIFVNKIAEQLDVSEVLSGLGKVLGSLNFPVSMRWSDLEIEYIRPIHWIVSLLDSQIIDLNFAGIGASNLSRGHRFLGSGKFIEITSASHYESQLEQEFVITNFEQRKKIIAEQIAAIAQQNSWIIPENEELLEEVTAMVEWPTAFYGEFEEEYLQVPHEMLITAMRDHQRYFYAIDKENSDLLPIFISVRNGNNDRIENVIRGNQKVLKARLSDAKFFYEEDLKNSLDDYLLRLETLNEHFKLGTLADKQIRVGQLVKEIGAQLKLADKELAISERASQLYKFDLVTLAVDEFSELQGVMGGIYAKHYGEPEAVVQAISQQYLPHNSGGDLPIETSSALLALADKLDTLMAYFTVGLIPTGSNDPFALRRQAMGLVEIIADQNWQLNLEEILTKVNYNEQKISSETLQALVNFVKARIQVYLENRNIDYDIIQSALSQKMLNPLRMIETAIKLQELRHQDKGQFRLLIENLSRVVNLGEKITEEVELKVDLAQTELEKDLINRVLGMHHEGEISERINSYQEVSPIIAKYFEEHMINADDETICFNRYQLMFQLTQLILDLFDPRMIVSK
ncbi:glycine--tRNA ligase subunit beta [Facklamia lactis]|uniref:glycine--tRNA ligase subunit beta n=1 Tax=Facklamia lactis TaxID=2749967 RepID=UPI0018CD910F|nr:glycine--tRNA ligase subunit beta [Facklamia lactis]MBG9980097.1 glycine--tRNA ligase subunit beta [Facklamia lactis]